MKKPETYGKLLEIVNPEDLLEVLDFCGINCHYDKEHGRLKKEFATKIYKSIYELNLSEVVKLNYPSKTPENRSIELTDIHYETIIKCIQDFYWWSRRFNHTYAHIYQRVVNALEIPIEEINEIYKKEKQWKQ